MHGVIRIPIYVQQKTSKIIFTTRNVPLIRCVEHHGNVEKFLHNQNQIKANGNDVFVDHETFNLNRVHTAQLASWHHVNEKKNIYHSSVTAPINEQIRKIIRICKKFHNK
jgi:hypothetical protein